MTTWDCRYLKISSIHSLVGKPSPGITCWGLGKPHNIELRAEATMTMFSTIAICIHTQDGVDVVSYLGEVGRRQAE